MKFVDEVVIESAAGHGGAGAVHFRREKFIPLGGPDGGNGGRGGSVYVTGDSGVHTLLDFRFQPRWFAGKGDRGGANSRDGKSGEDIDLLLPLGTQIFDAETDELLADVTIPGRRVCILKGGRGGKGNAFFKRATLQAPDFAQPGEPGDVRNLRLNLKVLADVGIVGLPNAGKSTFISRVSAARPKIADYPFTTLTPNLGVVRGPSGTSFVVADVPGLIPGAHLGKGLGITFLKHLERTRVLVHLLDATGPLGHEQSPEGIWQAYHSLRQEMASFSEELVAKKEVVVISKMEASQTVSEITEYFARFGIAVWCISSVTGLGISELIGELTFLLQTPEVTVESNQRICC